MTAITILFMVLLVLDGRTYMTSVQRATYYARTPRESKIKYEEDATIMMMQGSSDLRDCESTVGIDTDAELSISCFEADFLWLDKSKRAINSSSINGIGGGAKVLGRGPMACGLKKTASGKMEVLIDLNGVLVTTKHGMSDFRVFGHNAWLNGQSWARCHFFISLTGLNLESTRCPAPPATFFYVFLVSYSGAIIGLTTGLRVKQWHHLWQIFAFM